MELAAYIVCALLIGYAAGKHHEHKKWRAALSRAADPTEPLCTENLSTHIPPRSVYPREEG